MGRRRLDEKLMTKLAKKRGKKKRTDINKPVSSFASRNRMSSEAALVRLCEDSGIGTATYRRSLDASILDELRQASSPSLASISRPLKAGTKGRSKVPASSKATMREAARYLIHDPELQDRCVDLLLARHKFDRPINQAWRTNGSMPESFPPQV
jgi:hypothetical protein